MRQGGQDRGYGMAGSHPATDRAFEDCVPAACAAGTLDPTGIWRPTQWGRRRSDRVGPKASWPLEATLTAVVRRLTGGRVSRAAGSTSPCSPSPRSKARPCDVGSSRRLDQDGKWVPNRDSVDGALIASTRPADPRPLAAPRKLEVCRPSRVASLPDSTMGKPAAWEIGDGLNSLATTAPAIRMETATPTSSSS